MTNAERNKQAHEYQKAGDIDKAIMLYELNIQLKTDTGAAYNRLITIYNKQGDKENMRRILKLLLVLHEEKLKTLERETKNNRYLFNYEKQRLVVDFVRASIARLDPIISQIKKKDYISATTPLFITMKNAERNKQAQDFYSEGDIDKAIELYELNVELRTDTGASYISLCMIYSELEDEVNKNRILKLFVELMEDQLKTLEQAPKDKSNLLKIKQQKAGIEYTRSCIK